MSGVGRDYGVSISGGWGGYSGRRVGGTGAGAVDSPSASLQTSLALGTSLTVSRSGRATGDLVLGANVSFSGRVAKGAGVGVTGALRGGVLVRLGGEEVGVVRFGGVSRVGGRSRDLQPLCLWLCLNERGSVWS